MKHLIFTFYYMKHFVSTLKGLATQWGCPHLIFYNKIKGGGNTHIPYWSIWIGSRGWQLKQMGPHHARGMSGWSSWLALALTLENKEFIWVIETWSFSYLPLPAIFLSSFLFEKKYLKYNKKNLKNKSEKV